MHEAANWSLHCLHCWVFILIWSSQFRGCFEYQEILDLGILSSVETILGDLS